MAPGPQVHLKIVTPTLAFVNAVVAFENGTKVMLFAAARPRSGAPANARVLTVIAPVFAVTTLRTYFVGELASVPVGSPDSHPQPFATGKTVLLVDCTVSVTLVRHDDAAKMTSDTLARRV